MSDVQANNGQDQTGVQVPILTDIDVNDEKIQSILKYAGHLIRAAKEDSLAAVVCKHDDSDNLSTVLCYVYTTEDDQHTNYVPMAMLFGGAGDAWNNLVPPTAGIVIDEHDQS